MKTLRLTMNATIEDVSVVAREAKLRLENLDVANAEARKRRGAASARRDDERTRSAIASSLKMKLKTQMAEFQDLRAKLSSEYKEVVERRYFAVAGEKPDAETLDHLVEAGSGETIFQKAIMEQGRGQILDTVAEIQERHDAVRELERKLLELHQIFLDMSVLVEAQGEMLDNIETQVSKSVDYVQRGPAVALVAAAVPKKLAEVDVLLHHHRAAHRVRHLVAGTATLDAGLRVGTHGMKSMISTAAFVVTKRLLSGRAAFFLSFFT